jgi:hypothetical protein
MRGGRWAWLVHRPPTDLYSSRWRYYFGRPLKLRLGGGGQGANNADPVTSVYPPPDFFADALLSTCHVEEQCRLPLYCSLLVGVFTGSSAPTPKAP